MDVTATARSNIIKLAVGMFNAAPGATYLKEFEDIIAQDLGFTTLTKSLCQTSAFLNIYPESSTDAEFVSGFLSPLLDTYVTEENKQHATDHMLALLQNNNGDRADAILQILVALNEMPSDHSKFGEAAQAFANKAQVAEYFSVDLNSQATDINTLKSVIANVTQEQDSVTAALQSAESATQSSGKLIDGYIKGATVFLDRNNNGQLDPGETSTITDDDGDFTLTGQGNLVAFGGTDISTGLAFEGTLKAPAGSTVITPVTTVIAEIVESGKSVEEAQQAVVSALDLPSDIDLKTFDPIDEATKTGADSATVAKALDLQKANVQVANLLVQSAAVVTGATQGEVDNNAAIAATVKAIADKIAESASKSEKVDLTDASLVEETVNKASDKALETVSDTTKKAEFTAKVQDLADETAKVLTDANRKIQEKLDNADATNIKDALKEAAKIQTVTQGDAATAIRDGAKNGNLDGIEDNFSGDKLTEAANEVQIDDSAIVGDEKADTEQQPAPPPQTPSRPSPPAESITYTPNAEHHYGKIRGTSNNDVLELSESNGFTLSGYYGANFVGRGGNDTLIGSATLNDRAYYEEAVPEDGALKYNIQDDGSLIVTDGTQDLYQITVEQDDQGYYLSGIVDLKTDTINEGNDIFTDIDKIKISSTDDAHWLNIVISDEGRYEVHGNGVVTYSDNSIAGSNQADTLSVQGDVQNGVDPYPIDQYVAMIGYEGDDTLTGNPESPDGASYILKPDEAVGPLNYRYNEDSIEVIDSEETLLYSITLNRDSDTGEYSGTVIDQRVELRDEGTDSLHHINTVFIGIEDNSGWLQFRLSDSGHYEIQGSDIVDYRSDSNYIGGTSTDDVLDLNSQEAINTGFDPTNESTYIRIAGQGGNDQIIGAAGTDSAGYDLAEGELVGKLTAQVQDDGSVLVQDDNGALYSAILNPDGTGTVTDLRTDTYDEGTDSLENIERVSIVSRDGQSIEIERDSNDNLILRGTNIIEYYAPSDSKSGSIQGTDNDDTLNVADGPGFDPTDDTHSIYIRGYGGNDTITGGAGQDTAEYQLGKSGDMFELNGNLLAEVEADTQTVRVFDDMGTLDTEDDRDLYSITLGNDGSGRVTDLYTTLVDEGDDTLEGIEYVFINGWNEQENLHHSLTIQRNTDGEYSLSGTNFVDYYADSKTGLISGTKNDDNLSLRVDKGFDPTDSSANTLLTGHGGNDTITGGAGYDSAQYLLGYSNNSKSGDESELIGNLLAEVDSDTQTIRIYDDMDTSDVEDDRDLYSVQFNADGTGSVQDLHTQIQNEGTDTLEGIERIQIVGTSLQSEEQHQHINIEFDSLGSLNITGTNVISYLANPQGDGGLIRGTHEADTLTAPEGPDFSPTSSESMIRYEGAGGDDQINGNNSFDTAIYSVAFDESAGNLQATIDDQDPDRVVISNDNGDLYEISLALDGTGTVTDLHTTHSDEGTDTLTNIEKISIGDFGQWIAVTRDDSGNYHFSGTHIVEYISHSPTNNEVRGTAQDDIITVDSTEATSAGIDSTNASGWVEVNIRGNEGSDTLTGAATKDTAYYRLLDSEGIDGIIQAETQPDGTVIVRDNSQDLYRVELDQSGSGSVLDLLTNQYDEGLDTFVSGIDCVRIEYYSEQNQYLEITRDDTGNYQFSGSHVISYSVNQQYGNGNISGTALDDTLTAAAPDAVAAGFQPENASSTVLLEGKGGNDQLTGTDAIDIARYSSWNLDDSLGQLLPELQDDGTVIIKGGDTDLYRLAVDDSGNDIVTDLYTGDNTNEGIDTLTNIDRIAVTIYDDVNQQLEITRDDQGYHFSGTNIISYEPDGQGGGRIEGSVNDETLTAEGADGFSLSDTTSLVLEGKDGNDTLIGGAGATTAVYHAMWYEATTLGYRVEDASGTVTIFDTDSSTDLYGLTLDQNGDGQVIDLLTNGYNEGQDSLVNIDQVSFHLHDSGIDQALSIELTDTGLNLISLVGGNETITEDIFTFQV